MDIINISIILGGWFMLSLTGALAPGPLSAACVMQASRRGRLFGILPMVGHAIVELGIIAAIILTLQTIDFSPLVEGLMIGFGGVVVIVFGFLALKDYKVKPSPELGQIYIRNKTTVVEATLQGAIVSVLSPYFLLWWFAIGLGSIQSLMLELQIQGTMLFLIGILVYVVHVSTDFIFGAFLSIGTDTVVRKAETGDVNWINVFIGVFQLLLGLWFVWQALMIITVL